MVLHSQLAPIAKYFYRKGDTDVWQRLSFEDYLAKLPDQTIIRHGVCELLGQTAKLCWDDGGGEDATYFCEPILLPAVFMENQRGSCAIVVFSWLFASVKQHLFKTRSVEDALSLENLAKQVDFGYFTAFNAAIPEFSIHKLAEFSAAAEITILLYIGTDGATALSVEFAGRMNMAWPPRFMSLDPCVKIRQRSKACPSAFSIHQQSSAVKVCLWPKLVATTCLQHPRVMLQSGVHPPPTDHRTQCPVESLLLTTLVSHEPQVGRSCPQPQPQDVA